MERFLYNVRHAARAIRKRPQYSIVVVLTLAIAIGANTAIFSFVSAVLLKPLPFPNPSQLVLLQSKKAGEFGRVSVTDIEDLTAQSTLLEGLACFRNSQYIVTGTGAPEEITECISTSALFTTLGANPILGSLWPPEYDHSTVREALISYDFWKRYFSSDPSVVGKKVDLDSTAYGVIGVLPPEFVFPVKADIYEHTWVGHTSDVDRGRRNYIGIGRLKAGATLAQAQGELNEISARLMNTFPNSNAGIDFAIRPMRSYWLGNAGDYLIVLLLAGGFVLLIAGVNVINLILFEFFSRDKEMAVKIALGASRTGLIQQLLIESTMLGIIGGAIGLLLQFWSAPFLNSLIGVELPPWMKNKFNLTVLAFSVVVSIVTGLLAGLAPAFKVTRPELSPMLKEGARTSGSLSKRTYSRFLIIAEVALAVSLVTCAGLMIKSFVFLQNEDLGFKPTNILSVRIDPPGKFYGKVAQTGPLYKRILEELQSLPSVKMAAADHALPLANEAAEEETTRIVFTIEGQGTAEQAANPYGVYQNVSPGYFEMMSIPILSGRDFDSQDSEGSLKAAIISQRLAEYFWPSQDPIGKRVRIGRPDANRPWLTIIGVAGNVKRRSIQEMAGLDIYVSNQQFFVGDTFLIVGGHSSQVSLEDVSAAIWKVDPNLALFDTASMQERVSNTVWQQRLTCTLLIGFAVLALALASVGIYGVFSNHVLQRTKELGIRRALGAQRSDILRMVLSEVIKSTAVGVAVGLLAAGLLTKLLSGLLFKVNPHDITIFLGAPCLLVFIAIMASLLPAWRATEVEPIIALRSE